MASRLIVLLLAAAAVAGSEEKMFEPRFTGDNRMIRPEGYREWMFVGSNLNMGYSEPKPASNAPRPSQFHNIYIQREAYRQFAKTGRFPDKTVLVMEIVSAGTNASINKQGQFEDRYIGIETAVKDEKRFPDKWEYFKFFDSDGKVLDDAKSFPKEACWKCHNEHGSVDNVFVQFYPVLRASRPKP